MLSTTKAFFRCVICLDASFFIFAWTNNHFPYGANAKNISRAHSLGTAAILEEYAVLCVMPCVERCVVSETKTVAVEKSKNTFVCFQVIIPRRYHFHVLIVFFRCNGV